MRRFLLILICAFLFMPTSYAHPGRTDSKGGHTNHSTGEYHYHHGESAHQHVNGFCPYATVTPTPRATPKATPKASLATLPPSSYKAPTSKKSGNGNGAAALAGAGGTAIVFGGYSLLKRIWKS